MGVSGILKFGIRRIFEILVIVALIVFIPNLPPYANFSQPFTVAPARPLQGKLALNNRLNDVQIWHKGHFLGPESFADFNGELYTGLHLGDVVKLTGEHITPVVKFGKPCKGVYEESKCGRPLGLEFDKEGNLFVADAYYGLFKVNVETGEKQQLVSPNQKIGGRQPKIFNSVAIHSNGDIYWTDSSTDFSLEDGLYALLADPSGRLIHYDAKTKKNKVLIDKLQFPNGLSLSDDEEFIIVAETAQSRIHRYYLKGPKKGARDIFIDGLPGMPDNLKSDGKGGFLVPLIVSRDGDFPSLFQAIGPFPLIRKAGARLSGVTEFLLKKINQVFPSEFGAKAVHFIGHFSSILSLLHNSRVTLLRVNKNGEIIDSLHNTNKRISSISEVHVFRDTLYLGSPFNDYIAKIPLSKIGWEDLKVDRVKRAIPVETPKPTQTSKPTTTTPKPTTTTKPKPTITTPKPTTTTSKPATTTQKIVITPPPKQNAPPPAKQQPSPQDKTTAPSPQQQATTPPPAKQQQQTPPPAKQQQQTPPPAKQQQQTPPPAKQQQTPPTKQQQTPPPAKQQHTPPAKQDQQTPSPIKQQQQTPPSVKQQQQTPPPVKQQQQTSPVKQAQQNPTPVKQQQVPPPVRQQQNQSPPPLKQKQEPPPVKQQQQSQPQPTKDQLNPSEAKQRKTEL